MKNHQFLIFLFYFFFFKLEIQISLFWSNLLFLFCIYFSLEIFTIIIFFFKILSRNHKTKKVFFIEFFQLIGFGNQFKPYFYGSSFKKKKYYIIKNKRNSMKLKDPAYFF